MDRDKATGAPILNPTEARQAERVGLIWVLVASLAFLALVAMSIAIFAGGYFQ